MSVSRVNRISAGWRAGARTVMLGIASAVLWISVGAAGAAAAEQRDPVALPEPVRQALPEGAEPRQAQVASLVGDRSVQWIVLYEVTAPDVRYPTATVLTILNQQAGGWRAARTIEEPYAVGGAFEVHEVAGTPAVAFYRIVGAHSAKLDLVRWDGSAFAGIFDAFSNTPGFTFDNLDDDSTPELLSHWSPYCGSYATSPVLLDVYQWNGARYQVATDRFPALLLEPITEFTAALTGVPSVLDVPETAACLHDALAWLYGAIGDSDSAALHCAQSLALVPDRAMVAAAFC